MSFIADNRHIRKMHPEIISTVASRIKSLGGFVKFDPKTDLLTINGEVNVSLVICRCMRSNAGQNSWKVQLDAGLGHRLINRIQILAEASLTSAM